MTFAGQDTNANLRQILRQYRAKDDLFAAGLFVADVAMYAAAMVIAASHAPTLLRAAAGLCAGVLLAVLFVVGHDACHGSFTSQSWLNATIGRIAFLPTATPFSTWELSHNHTHHVYTNLKQFDHVWTPLSLHEYESLPRWRKKLERIYRHPAGLVLYYPFEIWWKRLLFPSGRYVERRKAIYFADSALAAAGFLSICALIARQGPFALMLAVAWPFAIWNWLMGWALLAQHTHPRVPWFDDERQWRAAQAQTRVTVHVVAPGPLNFLLHRIMEHTAHHLDVTVPLYHLSAAQTAIEGACAEIVVERWTPRRFLEQIRACKLYDYARNQWLDFDGRSTSAPCTLQIR
jgi:omega-6 fatty acid desaturase (delta-12 desaturase)